MDRPRNKIQAAMAWPPDLFAVPRDLKLGRAADDEPPPARVVRLAVAFRTLKPATYHVRELGTTNPAPRHMLRDPRVIRIPLADHRLGVELLTNACCGD
jgi:hypothetical protein